MNRVFDALITAAAADVAGHRFANLIVVGLGIFGQQGSGLHDLTGLAIAALRDIDLAPGLLNRMIAGGMQAFDGDDLTSDNVGNRGDAGAYCLFIDHHGAGSAERLAAAEFRAGQADFITEKPEQWKIRIPVPIPFLAVNLDFNHDRSSLFISC